MSSTPRRHVHHHGARAIEDLANIYVAPWRKRDGVSLYDVDNAEYWARNASKWDVAGGWRARVLNGTLHVKMLSMQPHWAERTSVLRVLLLTLRRERHLAEQARLGRLPPHAAAQHPRPPPGAATLLDGVDLVYVHNDRDPTPWRGHPRGSGQLIPLFTNAHSHGLTSLPLPEFSWVGWHTHTKPWCRLSSEVWAAGGRTAWANRTDVAFFSGGLDNGPMRKQLRQLSQTPAAQGVIQTRNVAPRFFTVGAAAKAGKDPPQPMSALCGYKYLISVAGYGYSNRLKSLLLCGSVVIHVKQPWNEFFFPLLKPNVHIAVAQSVADIIPTVQRLRANASLAQQIAANGRELAARLMTMDRVLDYTGALLRSYASVQRERATSARGFTPATTAADLGAITGQCNCASGTAPTAANCPNLDPYAFRRRRCCDGWDCPREICEDSVTAFNMGLAQVASSHASASGGRDDAAAAGIAPAMPGARDEARTARGAGRASGAATPRRRSGGFASSARAGWERSKAVPVPPTRRGASAAAAAAADVAPAGGRPPLVSETKVAAAVGDRDLEKYGEAVSVL